MKRILALALLFSSGAFAQCVMCFRTAAAQQAERRSTPPPLQR